MRNEVATAKFAYFAGRLMGMTTMRIWVWLLMMGLAGAGLGCNRATEQQAEIDGATRQKHRIDSLEVIVKSGKAKNNDQEMQQLLETLRQYQNYVIDYPRDTATPAYLLKTGQLYYSYLKDFDNAEEYLTHLVDSFPTSKHRPMGLFLLANAYHDTGDTTKAQDHLRILVREYKGSFLANEGIKLAQYIRTTKTEGESEDESEGGGVPDRE